MTMSMEKVLSLAAKLMAVQENRGASETEATMAAEKLQQLLQDHNLSMSQVEQAAGDGAAPVAKRVKDAIRTSVWQTWRAFLLEGIARNNFCLARAMTKWLDNGDRQQTTVIVGREVNINVTKLTYDYLVNAFQRAVAELGIKRSASTQQRKEFDWFMEGAVTRVVERLDERRRERERESEAAKQATTGSGTGKELVLSDVYGSEADLNNDALNGFPAGTTAARRRENAERMARQEAKREELIAAGMDSTIAWYISIGYSETQAVEMHANQKNQSQRRGSHRHSAHNWSRRDEAQYRKVNSAVYQAGRETGNNVGLDGQVGATSRKRLPKN